jgi:hypothetical protein
MSDQAMTLEERNEQLEVIRDQHVELIEQGATLSTVTCPCGRERAINRAVRCLYCDIWYCETCAEEHFGETRADYRKRNPFPKEPSQ